MNKLFIIAFCLVISFYPNQTIIAKTLHAILVADTVHPDINFVTKPDLQRWHKELRVIAYHTKMKLKEAIFSERGFHKERVKSYLESLIVDEKDCVIFYFSGHGYRTYQKKTPWPFILFEIGKPGLDIQWIADAIRSKNPQFSLIMTDCCNNYEEQEFKYEPKNIDANFKLYPIHSKGYEQLFCQAKGSVVISSSSAGQFSYGSQFGGLYTQSFFSSLNHELMQNQPNWKHLLQKASSFVDQIQNPVCKIYD